MRDNSICCEAIEYVPRMLRPVIRSMAAWHFAEKDCQFSNPRRVKAPRKKSIQQFSVANPSYSAGHAIEKACVSILPCKTIGDQRVTKLEKCGR
jgi:hypothetical protein